MDSPMKDFTDTFYTYDFTGFVGDFEIDLGVETSAGEPANNSAEVSNNRSVSDKTTRRLLQGEINILIVTDDDYIK